MSVIAVSRPVSGRIGTAVADSYDLAVRNIRNLLRTPQTLVFATVQPVMFVLLFRYACGGAIRTPGVRYADFLMPGVFAQSVAFGAIGTAVALSYDLRSGLLHRMRTLPMSRGAVLAGRTLADLIRNLLVVTVMAGVGFAVGFRTHNGAAAFLGALGLVALFAYALSWGIILLGLRVGDPEAAQAAGVPVIVVLVFTSPAFVPLASMPGWLQAFGAHQPVTALVQAERALTHGGHSPGHVLTSAAWSLGPLTVFTALAIHTYRRMNH
jgi:ABC transporter DrrB family efflux protein